MNIGLIIAGGVGARMQSETPKQFLVVKQKPIIIYEACFCFCLFFFIPTKLINFITLQTFNFITYFNSFLSSGSISGEEGRGASIDTMFPCLSKSKKRGMPLI